MRRQGGKWLWCPPSAGVFNSCQVQFDFRNPIFHQITRLLFPPNTYSQRNHPGLPCRCEDRLCFSAIFEMTPDAKIVNVSYAKAMATSTRVGRSLKFSEKQEGKKWMVWFHAQDRVFPICQKNFSTLLQCLTISNWKRGKSESLHVILLNPKAPVASEKALHFHCRACCDPERLCHTRRPGKKKGKDLFLPLARSWFILVPLKPEFFFNPPKKNLQKKAKNALPKHLLYSPTDRGPGALGPEGPGRDWRSAAGLGEVSEAVEGETGEGAKWVKWVGSRGLVSLFVCFWCFSFFKWIVVWAVLILLGFSHGRGVGLGVLIAKKS